MRYSVGLPVDHVTMADEFVTGDAIAEMAAAVEAAGLDAVFVTDHPAPDERWLAGGGHHAQEPMVALAFAAAATRRVMLHTHVYVAAYRNPFLAAKGVATLRHAVAIGDGWSPFPNPPAAARAVKTPAITNIDELATRLEAARAHAVEIDRADPLTICFAPFTATDDHATFAELGVDWLAVQFGGCTSRAEWLDRLGAFAARRV